MKPDYKWARLAQLSGIETHEILMARESVFVVEQDCPYQDADLLDTKAWHLIGRIDACIACYARVVDPGGKFQEPSVGRVLTTQAFRGHQLGRALMLEAMRRTREAYPGANIRISAQSRLRGFYESLDFAIAGEEYIEDDIPHIDMLWSARSQ